MAFDKLKSALKKTRKVLNTRVEDLFVPGRTLEPEELEELEEALIAADVGVESAERIVQQMKDAARSENMPAGGPMELLEEEVENMLAEIKSPARWKPTENPHVILLVGVNGTGKTTCAGKLAHRIRESGGKPLLAASDTFRAAAAEQLAIWGARAGVEVVTSESGADPASVAYDTVDKAVSGGFDAVIIDTAGRLHTRVNLMEELMKISRVCEKRIDGAPHDIFLVLDATTGVNGISQARLFGDSVGLSGIILTKLDGTARGGIALAIMRELDVPVLMVGTGESLEDLADFDPRGYAAGLFEE